MRSGTLGSPSDQARQLQVITENQNKKEKGAEIIMQKRTAWIELTEEEFTAIREQLIGASELPDSVKQMFRLGQWDPANRESQKKKS